MTVLCKLALCVAGLVCLARPGAAFLAPCVGAVGSSKASPTRSCASGSHSRSALQMAVTAVNSGEELDAAIKSAGSALTVVDYSTTWCGPCKIIYPKFEELSEQFTDASFLKVVGDSSAESTKLMKREGVRSVPAFHFWKDGKKVDSVNGANSDALEETVRSNV